MKRWLAFLLMAVLMLTAGTAAADMVMCDDDMVASLSEYGVELATTLVDVKYTNYDFGTLYEGFASAGIHYIDASIESYKPGDTVRAFSVNDQKLRIEYPDGSYEYIGWKIGDPKDWKNSDKPFLFYPEVGWNGGYAYLREENSPDAFHYLIRPNAEYFAQEGNFVPGTYTATFALEPQTGNYEFFGYGTYTFTLVEHKTHTWEYISESNGITHLKRCKLCKKSEGYYAHETDEAHKATCQKKAECIYCGEEYGDKLAHTVPEERCKVYQCEVCGDDVAPNKPHKPEATSKDCLTPRKCQVCGSDTEYYGNHDFDYVNWGYRDDTGHAYACRLCYKPSLTIFDHKFDNEEDPDCNDCGYEREIGSGELPEGPGEPDGGDPELPDTEIKIIVTKKLVGIDASDLPDGTVFEFSFIDLGDNSLNGKPLGRVEFKKGDLLAATDGSTKDVPIRVPGGKGLIRIGVTETGTERVSGYHVNVNMECSGAAEPGDKPEDRGDGSIPVGSFEIDVKDDVILDGDVNLPFQPIARETTEIPVAEIIITNTLTPIKIDLPKTGDESNLALWACAMLISGAAAIMLLRKKREA